MRLQTRRAIIYFVVIQLTMKLMMYIGNDLIEAIQVHDEGVRQPGYLGKFKRFLKTKHSELISQSSTPPEFLVELTRQVIPDFQPKKL